MVAGPTLPTPRLSSVVSVRTVCARRLCNARRDACDVMWILLCCVSAVSAAAVPPAPGLRDAAVANGEPSPGTPANTSSPAAWGNAERTDDPETSVPVLIGACLLAVAVMACFVYVVCRRMRRFESPNDTSHQSCDTPVGVTVLTTADYDASIASTPHAVLDEGSQGENSTPLLVTRLRTDSEVTTEAVKERRLRDMCILKEKFPGKTYTELGAVLRDEGWDVQLAAQAVSAQGVQLGRPGPSTVPLMRNHTSNSLPVLPSPQAPHTPLGAGLPDNRRASLASASPLTPPHKSRLASMGRQGGGASYTSLDRFSAHPRRASLQHQPV